ncbi:MAG: PKD domain-containing protein, partial [Sphingobacteriales bacterium]
FISSSGTNHTYEMEIIIYGDCSGGTYPTFATTTAAGLNIYNNGGLVTAQNLPKIAAESDILVSPVCPSQLNSTTCNGGVLPGIKKFTFRGNVVLNGASANWRFAFDGNLVNGSTAGRSNIADNIAANTTLYIGATLNNVNGQNNSPTFTSDPTPFFCNNVPSSFSLGAVDVDNDVMTYSLEPAISNVQGTGFVTYIAPYTATNPLPAAAGTFVFNPNTGVTDFTPNQSMEAIVVKKVSEKRNGVEVGTCAREMMFVIINGCTNTAPSTPINNVSNGELLPGTPTSVEFKACEAQQVSFTFDINALDPQGDNITITSTNLPAGATLDIQNNGTTNPTASFNWDLSTVPAGTYQFFITFKDDGCPMSVVKTVTYTVYVQQFNGNFTTHTIVPCRDDSNGVAWILADPSDTALYKYTWMDPAFNVLQETTVRVPSGDTLNNLLPGIYLVDAENYRGCKRRFTVTVDSPTYKAYFETDSIVCVNTLVAFNPNFQNNDFVQWAWDFGNGTTSTNQNPVLQYPYAGTYQIKLKATTDLGCVDSFSQWITVDSVMQPEFSLDRNSICVGEKINVATEYGLNAQEVNWTFGDGGLLQTAPLANISYSYPTPGTYNIDMTVSYRKCPDVTYTRTVTVNDNPRVYLGHDTAICYQGSPIELKNTFTAQSGETYSWNTGVTTPAIYATNHGVYALTVTRNDCSTTDSVTVNKDCYVDLPNAFTPNGDGASDYFFPRSLLSRGVTAFDMTIYNRWGEKVFFTNNTNGRGWDGNLSGKAQPTGVYVYQINVTFRDGNSEKYTGNVTLLR